jgi:hypothetical protein
MMVAIPNRLTAKPLNRLFVSLTDFSQPAERVAARAAS